MTQKPDLLSLENKTSPVDMQDSDLILRIKEWGGYSSKSISDSELLANLGINAQHIPSWFMKTTPWVLDNEITLEEFVNAIRYMHENQIIN